MKLMKYLLLFVTAFMSLQLQAQYTIKGIITDTTNEALIGAAVKVKGKAIGAATDESGAFTLTLPKGDSVIIAEYMGFISQEIMIDAKTKFLKVKLVPVDKVTNEFVVTAQGIKREELSLGYSSAALYESKAGDANIAGALNGKAAGVKIKATPQGVTSKSKVKTRKTVTQFTPPVIVHDRMVVDEDESYAAIKENNYQLVKDQPLSTFSIDVDRASYSNVRRYLNNGNLPPVDAVRIEEMINYFDYKYKSPVNDDPVAIYTDMATCPWEPAHQLVRVALKAKELPLDKLPAANLVFLLDVSGSMDDYNKLPLVKQALAALVQQLRSKDKVAIVTYAGAANVALPSTAGSEKTAILNVINQLQAGGSTAGGDGLKMAYDIATEHFMKNGNNRIIMATDGDFNVGESSEGDLETLIEKKRTSGVSLSVIGFGMGNVKDDKLELLADKGNGNYAYIDNFEEARRTFVTEFGSTLFTVAKDVKLQLEFNPQYVQSYRLVGYENRMLENKDFNDDKKDAGDMGVGHTVTALYELISTGAMNEDRPLVDSLKYQRTVATSNYSGEVLTVKLRYKQPKENKSQLLSSVMPWKVQDIKDAPEDFRMAAAVAEFGLLLRNSEHKGKAGYNAVLLLAKGAKGDDEEGYRSEFIQLVKKAGILKNEEVAN
ncbi:vWA domain-containing protein [Chitinophaga sancti]|uniref:Ca-activated chloride channel family protein n=2 Tax=Chitinophaga sancti TaxID=1004 RepID=A0A1K1SPE8_9BACT|nr:VWA domain-containing protein [Chitinophaga sancti]WQG87801.1 von Willebrand factor type A domain-containing protein [Chitinophaga sancti]SFW85749.1 Ca-activated chloride channel family protein [Chitinophaga sancti]